MTTSRGTTYLAIEAGVNLSAALALHLIVIGLLGTDEYANYAVGLTIGAVATVSALGIPVLVPEWVSRYGPRGLPIGAALAGQLLASIAFTAAAMLVQAVDPGILGEGLGVTSALILAAGIQVFSQQLDEAAQVYFRITARERLSLAASLATKGAIVLTASAIAVTTQSGVAVYQAVAVVLLAAALAKAAFLLARASSPDDIAAGTREVIASHRNVWLGNVSNMLFNGVIRLIIGENLGKPVLAVIALAAQIAAAAQTVVASLSLRAVMRAVQDSNTDPSGSLRRPKTIAWSAALLCAIASTGAAFYILYGRTAELASTMIVLTVLVPISAAYALTVASVPYYQVCQFQGAIRRVALFNFSAAVVGSLMVWVADMLGAAKSLIGPLFFLIAAASSFLIIRTATALIRGEGSSGSP